MAPERRQHVIGARVHPACGGKRRRRRPGGVAHGRRHAGVVAGHQPSGGRAVGRRDGRGEGRCPHPRRRRQSRRQPGARDQQWSERHGAGYGRDEAKWAGCGGGCLGRTRGDLTATNSKRGTGCGWGGRGRWTVRRSGHAKVQMMATTGSAARRRGGRCLLCAHSQCQSRGKPAGAHSRGPARTPLAATLLAPTADRWRVHAWRRTWPARFYAACPPKRGGPAPPKVDGRTREGGLARPSHSRCHRHTPLRQAAHPSPAGSTPPPPLAEAPRRWPPLSPPLLRRHHTITSAPSSAPPGSNPTPGGGSARGAPIGWPAVRRLIRRELSPVECGLSALRCRSGAGDWCLVVSRPSMCGCGRRGGIGLAMKLSTRSNLHK